MPEFKIVAEGTHGTMTDSNVTMDAPPVAEAPQEGQGEQPKAPEKPIATQEQPASPPGSTANGEQPKVNQYSAKLGKAAEQPASNGTEPKPSSTSPAQPPDLKSFKLADVLKAHGFNDDTVTMLEVLRTTGNLDRYAEAKTTDFSKMTPEQVMRYDLRRQYPDATPDQFETLFGMEVMDKYKLDKDMYDPESKEAKAAKVKMELDARRLATKYGDEMKQYVLPSADPMAEIKKQQEQVVKDAEEFRTSFFEHPITKAFEKDKKVTLSGLSYKDDTGKEVKIPDFVLEAEDTKEITGILTDTNVYAKYVLDKEGNPDINNQYLDAMWLHDRPGFARALINFGKMLGKEELIEEKNNPPKNNGQPAGNTPKKSLQETFVSEGRSGKGG